MDVCLGLCVCACVCIVSVDVCTCVCVCLSVCTPVLLHMNSSASAYLSSCPKPVSLAVDVFDEPDVREYQRYMRAFMCMRAHSDPSISAYMHLRPNLCPRTVAYG